MVLQHADKIIAGELAALISIKDRRLTPLLQTFL